MGEAVAQGAAALVTSGAPQSNHARLTAAAAARLGLRAVLVLSGSPPDAPRGNLPLDELFGARVVWAGDVDEAALTARAHQEADRLCADGVPTTVVPFGGTSVTGARGCVQAARELLSQVPDLTAVVVAVGSGGTMAGLVHGLGAERVLGIDTGAVAVADPERRVLDLLRGLAGHEPTSGLRVRRDVVGDGYAHLTDDVREAMTLVARSEGIALDPVCTGRAAAGLVATVHDGTIRPGDRTVLLHTGGLPGLFGHPDAGTAWSP